MAETKTKPSNRSVEAFLNEITEDQKRQDAFIVLELMKNVTGESAVLWGDSIIGFGSYHYKYASGHEGDACILGFSPRKQNLVIYLLPSFGNKEELLSGLGKYKLGKGCLYINKLKDIDMDVLKKLLEKSLEEMKTIIAGY